MSKYVYAEGLPSLIMDGTLTWRLLRLLERIAAAGACSARLQVLREARAAAAIAGAEGGTPSGRRASCSAAARARTVSSRACAARSFATFSFSSLRASARHVSKRQARRRGWNPPAKPGRTCASAAIATSMARGDSRQGGQKSIPAICHTLEGAAVNPCAASPQQAQTCAPRCVTHRRTDSMFAHVSTRCVLALMWCNWLLPRHVQPPPHRS
jgi:hypothetical protein